MYIQRKHPHHGPSGLCCLASSIVIACCAIVWGGDRGQLVQPARPISFTPSEVAHGEVPPERDPLDDPHVTPVRVRLKSKPKPEPRRVAPRTAVIQAARPLTMATAEIVRHAPPLSSKVSRPAPAATLATVPTAADRTPLETARASLLEMSQELDGAVTEAPRAAAEQRTMLTKVESARPGVYYRSEIDRLARRRPTRRLDADSTDLGQADCRPAVLSFLSEVAGPNQNPPAFAVTLLQPSQVADLQLVPADDESEEAVVAEDDTDQGAVAEDTTGDDAVVDQSTSDLDSGDLPDDGLISIAQVGTNIRPTEGMMPDDYAGPRFLEAGEKRMPEGASREWPLYAFWWEAPATMHRPLYFEQPNLERHGYSRGLAQPILSGAHFFATIPALPYLMGANSPHQPIYTLGHYRPGSWAPFQFYYPPLSLKGALAEGGTLTGLIFLIP